MVSIAPQYFQMSRSTMKALLQLDIFDILLAILS